MRQGNHQTKKDITVDTQKFYSKFINLSDSMFVKKDIHLLNKGLKYCPDTYKSKDLDLLQNWL